MRILIADDEVRARLGLVRILSRHRPEHEIIGAVNGAEAMDRFRVQPIDLVVTDVIMPIMDGLGLIEAIRGQASDTAIIVLSAHDEFEYARAAMRFGVRDYLLKPFSEQTFLTAVDRVQVQLQSAASVDRDVEDACETRGAIHSKPSDLPARVIQISGLNANDRIEQRRVTRQLEALSTKGALRPIAMRTDERSILLSVFLAPQDEAWLETELQSLLERMYRDHGCVYIAGIGSKVSPEELHLSLRAAQEASALAFYYSQPKVFVHERCTPTEIPWSQWRFALMDAMHTSVQALEERLARILTQAAQAYLQPKKLMDFMQEWFDEQIAANQSLILRNRAVTLGQMMRQASESVDAQTYAARLAEVIVEIGNAVSDLYGDKTALLIEQTIAYIQENYQEASLSLDEIASRFHFNSAYYSNLFKRNTGMTIMQYLSRTRLDRAKELLLTTRYKVYEIAAMVGYADVHYFMRVFTREAGMTPGMYRLLK